MDVRSSQMQLRARGAFRRAWILLAVVVVVAACGYGVYQRSHARGTDGLRVATNSRLDLFASVVEAHVRRLEPVPATIQLNPVVVHMLRSPSHARVVEANHYLMRLNAHLGSEAVFVMDERGVVRASSNALHPDDSQLGEDVSYRPYYLDALAGRATRHFAIGSGGEAGYFVAHPIYAGAQVIGVAAIKIALGALDQTWDMLGSSALVADANRVVILSSQPAWRYTTIVPLSAEQRVDLHLTRTYGAMHLPAFPVNISLTVDEDSQAMNGVVRVHDQPLNRESGLPSSKAGYLVLGRSLDGMDWRVLIFTSLIAVHQQALVDGVSGAVSVAFLILLALFWGQRRRIEGQKRVAKRLLEQANAELELEVSRRTQELTDANTLLRKEVAEREQTEKSLRAAQDELVHAGKMAVLGQLAASITHELTQPLGAIRTLSGNAAEFLRRGKHDVALENLSIVGRLVEQMASIIDPLKGFARKSAAHPEATDPGRVVERALFLFQLRLKHEKVVVENQCPPGVWTVWCDGNRLEQVLINLIGNALDAMRDATHRRLCISAQFELDRHPPALAIRVQDSGKGLSEADLAHIFQPFYTTKASGAGLGLGLVISRDIATEFGGSLIAEQAGSGGACFTLTVPFLSAGTRLEVQQPS